MKVIAIGDIHGRDTWKKIVRQNPWTSVVFVWDYFDSRKWVSTESQIRNFQAILNLRRENKERVHLLIGNHDFHYLPFTQQRYSWYQHTAAEEIWEVVQYAIGEIWMKCTHVCDEIIYSHAWISNTWLRNNCFQTWNDIEDFVNNHMYSTPQNFEKLAWNDRWNDIYQSPIWIRPESLEKDSYPMKQVVGHTSHRKISFSPNGQIAYIDTLWTCGEYLAVENGKFKVRGSRRIPKGKIDEMGEYFEKIENEYRFKFREDFFYKDNKVPTSIIPVKRWDILWYIDGKSIISPIDGFLCSPYDFGDAFKTGYFFTLRDI